VSNKSLIAGLIALAMGIWLFSGELVSNTVTAAESDMQVPTGMHLVRGIESVATERQQLLAVRGQTKANRLVQVKSEVSGKIQALPAVKGTQVKQGDLLCEIAVDTRASELDEARAEFKSAQFEYAGIVDLKQRKLQSEINVAKANAALESARANVIKAELALTKTRIIAPFDGVVESQPVEIGDFLSVGQVCVALMEIDPMLVAGQVSEKNIGQVAIGDKVQVSLITGEHFIGELSFISRAPDAATRTYPIEVTIKAPGNKIRTGMTADLNVPVGLELAHLISPASLVLSDAGNVGVRIVDDSDIVRFMEVTIVSEEVGGIWVKGLPVSIRLITVGQEEVFDGQPVTIDLTPLSSVAKF
jgi:multidrug efflux system membrane fusion protein